MTNFPDNSTTIPHIRDIPLVQDFPSLTRTFTLLAGTFHLFDKESPPIIQQQLFPFQDEFPLVQQGLSSFFNDDFSSFREDFPFAQQPFPTSSIFPLLNDDFSPLGQRQLFPSSMTTFPRLAKIKYKTAETFISIKHEGYYLKLHIPMKT
jgi:hypothetical protein